MMPLYGHSGIVAEFVGKMIPGGVRGFGNCTAIGVIDDAGRLVGGTVYHNWNPETGVIEITAGAISKRWLTRSIVKAIFDYPINQIGCQLVVARVDLEDKINCRIWRAFGAQEYVIPRLRGRDKPETLFTLTEETWNASKFARERFPDGKAQSAKAA